MSRSHSLALSHTRDLAKFAGIREAYLVAALDIYGMHLLGTSEYGEPAFRAGVVRASGEPLSRYSARSDRRTRVSLRLELSSSTQLALDAVQVGVDEEKSPNKNSWSSFASATETEECFFGEAICSTLKK